MNTARTLMLVATGIGIVIYISWLLLMAFFLLMAESGGKDSQPLLALALLWPLGELIWTWAWGGKAWRTILQERATLPGRHAVYCRAGCAAAVKFLAGWKVKMGWKAAMG